MVTHIFIMILFVLVSLYVNIYLFLTFSVSLLFSSVKPITFVIEMSLSLIGQSGDTVPDDNPCAKCKCMNGDVTCSYTNCTNPNCDNSYTPKGECCPKCVEGSYQRYLRHLAFQTIFFETKWLVCYPKNKIGQ